MAINTGWAQRLAKAAGNFTKSEKEIAEFIKQSPHETAFLSMKELCEKTGISKPTVIEFYKKLGYSNYQDFRSGMIDFYEHHINSYRASTRIFSKISSLSELIQAAADTDIQSLNLFTGQLSENDLSYAAEQILKAGTVYLYGPGTGFYPAHYLHQRLKRYRLNVQLLPEDNEYIVDSLFPAGPEDLLLSFMYTGITGNFVSALKSAAETGMTRIIITGSVEPEFAELSDRLVYVNRGVIDFKNSMAVPMHFANLLLLAVELKGGEKLKSNLKILEERRKDYFNI